MQWPIFERGINIWDPWREMKQLREEMERVMGRYVPERWSTPTEYPAVNIWSNDINAIVTAEVAGIAPDKLDISVQKDQLTIRGSRASYECKENEVYHRQERGCGDFVRTVGLPFEVDSDKIDAVYKNGVLKVSMPRAEHLKPKQISVKTE